MAKPRRGRGSSPSASPSRSRSFSGSDSRSASASSFSRSRSRSLTSSSSRSPPPPRKSSTEPSRRPRSPLPLVKNASPPRKPLTTVESKVLHIVNLTRNVNEGHLREIFRNFGEVVNVELAVDRTVNLPKGYGYVEFKMRTEAEKAHLYMNGAQIDGNIVTAKVTLPPREKVSHAKASGPPKRDVVKSDSAEVGKDGPKRNREVYPRPRRSPIARRGGSRRGLDPPARRRVDSPIRHRDSPSRRGDSPIRRRPLSPRGRSPFPGRRPRSPINRASPRRRGSPIRRRSPFQARRRCGVPNHHCFHSTES